MCGGVLGVKCSVQRHFCPNASHAWKQRHAHCTTSPTHFIAKHTEPLNRNPPGEMVYRNDLMVVNDIKEVLWCTACSFCKQSSEAWKQMFLDCPLPFTTMASVCNKQLFFVSRVKTNGLYSKPCVTHKEPDTCPRKPTCSRFADLSNNKRSLTVYSTGGGGGK